MNKIKVAVSYFFPSPATFSNESSLEILALFVMISRLILLWDRVCGFTINPDFIGPKWRLRRKYSLVKCVIRVTEIRLMETRLYVSFPILFVWPSFSRGHQTVSIVIHHLV